MRKFQPFVGSEVDLDDPETYRHLPQTVKDVLDRLYREVGYATLYMRGHKFAEVQSGENGDAGKRQMDRVEKLIDEIAAFFGGNLYSQPLIFWQEKLFVFLDEIENMC